jgi:hypothetical protein
MVSYCARHHTYEYKYKMSGIGHQIINFFKGNLSLNNIGFLQPFQY